ncbi:MAG: hypothetical protein K2I67_01250 [Malacoplasma sp.]|nr:hypothetical protein [Malacoplasma sp.]
MKRKVAFISGFSLFSSVLLTLVSCASSENQNLNQSINQQNDIKDLVMNVGTKYAISENETTGKKILTIGGNLDESKKITFNYDNENEWKKVIFPNGNWKELNDYWLGKKYQAKNFSNPSLFENFFSYGKDFRNLTKEKINEFDKEDINFNNIHNKYISGYAEIKIYEKEIPTYKSIYLSLYFSLAKEKLWETTKNNYDISFTIVVPYLNEKTG